MKKEEYNNFSKGFYIWFGKEKEYYITPLYLYKTKRTEKNNEYSLKLEKDISKVKIQDKEVTKCLTTSDKPYADRLGMLLINFINADFSDYASSYNTFFYAYGFDLLGDYSCMKTHYANENEFIEDLKTTYDRASQYLVDLQNTYKDCLIYVYNLDDSNNKFSTQSKFEAYAIKDDNIYQDSKDIDIILDNYIDKHHENKNESLDKLAKRIEKNDKTLLTTNMYYLSTLNNALFLDFKMLSRSKDIVKECQNCGRYFIPQNKISEVYCDLPNVDGSPTCREKGARQTYNKTLYEVEGKLIYRRTYQRRIMEVNRNPDNAELKEKFVAWRKAAQEKQKEFKNGKISEKEFNSWMKENKDR